MIVDILNMFIIIGGVFKNDEIFIKNHSRFYHRGKDIT